MPIINEEKFKKFVELIPELKEMKEFSEKTGYPLTWQQLNFLLGNRQIGKTTAIIIKLLTYLDKATAKQENVYIDFVYSGYKNRYRFLVTQIYNILATLQENKNKHNSMKFTFNGKPVIQNIKKQTLYFSNCNHIVQFRNVLPREREKYSHYSLKQLKKEIENQKLLYGETVYSDIDIQL